ncbi:RHS repeat domain-containing protein, partial [Treponema socranskii]|uniref:RHS repeat domain-containing protein n=1 Tax=Treponema socranskii TaxID=53419 RepID=UPI003D902CF6
LSTSKGESKQTKGFVDINGDGLPDYFSGNFRLNVGDGFTAGVARQDVPGGELTHSTTHASSSNFSASLDTGISAWRQITQTKAQKLGIGANTGIGGNFSISSSKINRMLIDINGDGLPDLVTKGNGNTIGVRFNTGSTFAAEQPFSLGEWNGVGMSEDADIAVNVDYQAAEDKTGLSLKETDTDVIKDALRETIETLKSSLEYSSSINFGISGNMGMNVNVGLTFFWGTINITANVGGTIDYSSGTNGTEVRMTDLDGDGLADHVLCLPDGQIWYKRNLCGKAGLLKGIDFPYGGSCRITYGEQYGTVHMPQFKYVLESVTLSDGCGVGANIAHGAHEITTRYAYADGVYDRYRKEFYGYGSVRSFSGWKGDGEYESETISEYYNDAYYAKGMIKSTVVKDRAGKVYARTKNAINNRYAYYDAEVSVRYEGREYGQGTKSTYGYDGYGNVTEVRQDTYYNADIDSILAGVAQSDEREGLRAEIGYYHNDGKYFHAHPTSIAVYGSGTLLRKREGDYDSTTGALASLRQYYDSSHYAEHRFTYDEYGNTVLVFEPGGSVRRYRYDDIVHQYPTTIAKTGSMERVKAGRDNPRNATYESSIEWDVATGVKKREKDINGNVMSYVYDAQQRLTEVRSPYDTGGVPAVRYSYHTPEGGFWYAVTENKVVTDAHNTEVIKTFIQTDGLGRAIISAKTGCTFDVTTKTSTVGWNVGGAVSYDAKGRTIAEGQPHFIKGESIAAINLNGDVTISEVYQLIRPTEKAYDALDRVVETVLPGVNKEGNKRIQTVRYGITDDGLSYTETTDPEGNVGVQYADARGNIVKVERYSEKDTAHPLTSATYEYDAMGQMIAAYDAARNPITVTYDMLGRKTELTTKDGGTKRYTYDELHLLYEDDAVMRQSGSRIDYSYDGFNRVIKIEYPEGGDVEYEYGAYGAANNAAGKVVSVRDEAGVTRYEYGKLGEVTKETRTLKRHIPAYESEKSAVMEYVSDYLGRMQKIVYPDREVVTYGYDAGGQVCSITGDHDGQAYTYVADIGYDEYGQRIYIKYGNGVETNYTYDKDMRWLAHIDTQNTYGMQYQNIDYSFDDVGNVLGYENNCMNGSRYRTEQTYTYDALYQLIKAEGVTEDNPYAIPGSPDYSSTYTQDFSFDAIGNMTHKKSEETITPAIQKKGGDDLNYEFTYEYDAEYAHRLKRAGNEQKGWRYYTYDANGNVTSESDGAAPNEDTTTLTPVTVTTQTNAAGESVYEADYAWAWPWGGSGNSGKKPVPNNKRRYEWNSRNLLMRSVNSVYDTRYAYAADGNRAAKWTMSNSSETLYFNTMWTWHTDTGLPEGQYSKHIYLGETRVVTKQTSKLEASYGQSDEWQHRYYYHPDHLGSAQLVTDYEGNEYQRIEYTPYGELWVEKKTEREEGLRYLPYKFTAKEQDEETGLYYYGARYLDAKYSRWMSADPAVGEYIPQAPISDEARKHNQSLPGMGGVFNVVNLQLYHYAGNNPVKYTDPDGNCATIAFTIVGGVTGGVSGILQGKKLGSKEFWGGIIGGIASGFCVGLATDLTVATGGAAAFLIVIAAGAVGGGVGSAVESAISGEKINPLNVILDAAIGATSVGIGKVVGQKLARAFAKNILMQVGGKNVIEKVSKETGALVYAYEKNSEKIMKALVTQGIDKTLGLMTDILQDIIGPTGGVKNE